MVLHDIQFDFEELWFLKITGVSNLTLNGFTESKSANNYRHMNETGFSDTNSSLSRVFDHQDTKTIPSSLTLNIQKEDTN